MPLTQSQIADVPGGAFNVDEDEIDAPFAVAPIPAQYDGDGGHTQENVGKIIARCRQEGVPPVDYLQQFNSAPLRKTKLSSMKRLFDMKNSRDALRLLSDRRFITIDDNFKLNPTGELDMLMHMSGHFLDYVMYMGNRRGLDAALPNINVNHTMEFRLNLNMTHRLWPTSNTGDLPFIPTGRMMCIGSRMQENIWLAMVPKTILERNCTERVHLNSDTLDAPTSAMTREHSLMITMFFAHILHSMQFQDVHCIEKYPELTTHGVKHSTNILNASCTVAQMDACLICMGYANMQLALMLSSSCAMFRMLHIAFRNLWKNWVRQAPELWKRDQFLLDNYPVALTMRYGQNQDLRRSSNSTQVERENWNKDHDYEHVMLFSFSLASHINFSVVHEWANVPPEVILAREGNVFTAPPGHHGRQEIEDLENYDLLDEDGKEIPIYTAEGYMVLRRAPPNNRSTSGGAFLDLTKAPTLFVPEDAEEDFNIRAVPCYLYPLAFTKTLGNMQADGLIHSFQQQLPLINRNLSTHLAGHDEDDNDSLFGDMNDNHNPMDGQPILQGLRCQAYNSLSHRVRERIKFHSVQLGRITAAVSGCTATGVSAVSKWERCLQECEFMLPHEQFHVKVTGGSQPQSMRFENTYRLEVSAMMPEDKNGSVVYDRVITPLLRTWMHPDVQRSVRQVLVPLAADVVPGIFEWTTYPITCFLQLSWDNLLPQLQQPDVSIDPHVIEIISVFERVLNYAHTGAARVLIRALMDRTWTSLGLMFDGFPCVWGRFLNHDELVRNNIRIYSKQWPLDTSTQRPITSSRRVQELTYGCKHYESYIARFTILHAMKNLPQHVYVDVGDPCKRLACFAAEVGLRVYIEDVKHLVSEAVSKELRDLFLDEDDQINAELIRNRDLALQRWCDSMNPLSYTESTLMDLIRAVSDHRDEDPHLRDPQLGTQTLSFFVGKIITVCKQGNTRRQPPFIQDGKALPVLKMTIAEIRQAALTARVPADSISSFTSHAFILACKKLKINHIPWVHPRDRGAGAPSTYISHKVWLSVGAAEPPPVADAVGYRTPEETSRALVRKSSQRLIAGDPSGAWSALQVKLLHFHTVLHKAVLPLECSMANVNIPKTSPDYISSMYHWVLQNFDMTKPIHFLALFASTAFSGLLPAIHSPSDHSLLNRHSEDSRMQYIRSLPWIEKNRKGSTDPSPFIFMFTAYILGFYETSSPVGERIRKAECLRKWLDKNSAKGMTLLSLCRFGLASPRNNGVFHAGQWGKDVIALLDSTLAGKRDAVVEYLRSSPEYGAFDAIQYLAGSTTAMALVENGSGYVKARPMAQASGSSSNSASAKRMVNIFTEDDDISTSADATAVTCTGPYKRPRLS
ncbi:hypothetical protein EDD15DRAFT_2380428 [Pisolithus albus]|nr:hypothetical protein EDD15DRAFT_2380428 [Pisolithus albus]